MIVSKLKDDEFQQREKGGKSKKNGERQKKGNFRYLERLFERKRPSIFAERKR